MKLLLNRDR